MSILSLLFFFFRVCHSQTSGFCYLFRLLLLDEIDQLEQVLLYKLFELALLPTSTLILIGISNSLDLVDRTLPRLRAKHLEPELLHFAPYSFEAISTIVKERLASIKLAEYLLPTGPPTVLFEAPAIELCARKLTSSGDVRKVLDTCRKALEIADTVPVKTLHMVKAISASSTHFTRIQGTSLHGKVILVAALAGEGELDKVGLFARSACLVSGTH